MENINVRIRFFEPVLGMSPSNENIYRDFIGSKSPDAESVEEEVEAIGTSAYVEKQMTIFPKEDGKPFIWDYQIKGFFKDACGGLRKVKGTLSSKCKAYKKEIDKLIFPEPRKIFFENYGTIGECQRPLRASTPQGERISLAISEEIQAGAVLEFTIVCFTEEGADLVREWLDYGKYSGFAQWRNSGKGRFLWSEIDANGEIVGGNDN
ncbi:MAG: hypothetical protein J6Q10_00110 [Clostridia bacterium]|nr:hypothetical protein [Clostridia bacterium]